MKMKFIFFLFLLLPAACSAETDSCSVYALSSEKGVFVSSDGGHSWQEDCQGLPARVEPLRIYSISGFQYLTTYNQGLFKRPSGERTWQNISCDEFLIPVQFSGDRGYRKISAFAADKNDPMNIAAATKHDIFRSMDGGKTWQRMNLKGMGSKVYITALEVDGADLYAGTSCSGLYFYSGKSFVSIDKGLPREPYSRTYSFMEEVSSVTLTDSGLFAGFRYGAGIYVRKNNKEWIPFFKPPDGSFAEAGPVFSFKGTVAASAGTEVLLKSDSGRETVFMKNEVEKLPADDIICLLVLSEDKPPLYFCPELHLKKEKKSSAWNKRGIYANRWAAEKNSSAYIKMMNKFGLNAVVIDMKDDFGCLYYPTELKTAHEIKAAKKPADVKGLLKKFHDSGIYVIARIVVFKDEKMFRAYSGRYAIRDSRTGAPWKGTSAEYWVDPYSEFVQDYNISIGRELESLGFDEIQYDYIRFPSDGAVDRCEFSFKRHERMYKSEILSEFLIRAKSVLKVPVSVDIYGFNSWFSFGNMIGQDMESFSYTADVICPMVYPSHFGNRFCMNGPGEDRSYRLVYNAGRRGRIISEGRVLIRPWLQGFKFLSPDWGPGYISDQKKASEQSGCSGFFFWNAAGDYKMVKKGLEDSGQ